MVRLKLFLSKNVNHLLGVNIDLSKIAGSLPDYPVYQFLSSETPSYRNRIGQLILLVIMPQIKQDSSLATATVALL